MAVVGRVPLIAGNWKMNLNHLEAILMVQKLSWTLAEAKHDYTETEVAVFPPFTDLRSVQTLVISDKLGLNYGAQDLSVHDSGAYTGEVSGAFISALEAKYVLVGHSERRTLHSEDDDTVSKKAVAAYRNGLVPIVCVGETAEDLEQYGASAIPLKQLEAVLETIGKQEELVIAYEPVWAIGSGKAAEPKQAQEVAKVLRDKIAEVFDKETADKARILYGGSVKGNNIASFMKEADVDGALVGGASLDPDEFATIVQFRKHVGF